MGDAALAWAVGSAEGGEEGPAELLGEGSGEDGGGIDASGDSAAPCGGHGDDAAALGGVAGGVHGGVLVDAEVGEALAEEFAEVGAGFAVFGELEGLDPGAEGALVGAEGGDAGPGLAGLVAVSAALVGFFAGADGGAAATAAGGGGLGCPAQVVDLALDGALFDAEEDAFDLTEGGWARVVGGEGCRGLGLDDGCGRRDCGAGGPIEAWVVGLAGVHGVTVPGGWRRG